MNFEDRLKIREKSINRDIIFRYKDKTLKTNSQTILCGIINVTPDSFSDGGKYYETNSAVERAKKLISKGAKMLDIGGESTRPGSHYVEIEEEIRRVVPVIKAIKEFTDIPISIDTWKSEVARAAIEAGADIVNDITGFLGDSNMAKVVGGSNVGAILMFNAVIARPEHESSKIFPKFNLNQPFTDEELDKFSNMNIIDIMDNYYQKSLRLAKENNIEKDRIMLDPGIGFGLTKMENLYVLDNIDIIKNMGYFTFLGVSRKRFINNILQESGFEIDPKSPEGLNNTDNGSAQISAISAYKGVEVLRVHTISKHLMAVKIADSIRMIDDEIKKGSKDINFSAYKN